MQMKDLAQLFHLLVRCLLGLKYVLPAHGEPLVQPEYVDPSQPGAFQEPRLHWWFLVAQLFREVVQSCLFLILVDYLGTPIVRISCRILISNHVRCRKTSCCEIRIMRYIVVLGCRSQSSGVFKNTRAWIFRSTAIGRSMDRRHVPRSDLSTILVSETAIKSFVTSRFEEHLT